MQKNVPKYTPDWVPTVPIWAEASNARSTTRSAMTGARCCGWPTSGPSSTTPRWGWPTISTAQHIWCSTSTRRGDDFATVVAVAHLVRQALTDSGLAGAVKTSGAKGVHVFVPIDDAAPVDDVAAATRALAARAEASTPTSPPRRSSSTTAAARCSSTPPAQAAPPSRRRTARGCARAHRCRFRSNGPSSTGSRPRDFTVHTGDRRARGGRAVGGVDAARRSAARRPDRARPHHPGRPGGGDARGQAAGKGTA